MRCQYKRARFEEGQCQGKAVPGRKYCKLHAHKEKPLIEKDIRKEKLPLYWNEALELIEIEPKLSLMDLFGFMKVSFDEIDKITISIKKIQDWYRRTQEPNGHPVEIIAPKYVHLISKAPYKDILENGIPDTIPDKIVKYTKENPKSTLAEISKNVGADSERVIQIVIREGLDIICEPTSLDLVYAYFLDFNNPTAREVHDATGVSTSSIYKMSNDFGLELKKKDAIAFGCTSKGQAIRYGKWILYSEGLEQEMVTFATGIQGAALRPGDIIDVQDSDEREVLYSGRVTNSATSTTTEL